MQIHLYSPFGILLAFWNLKSILIEFPKSNLGKYILSQNIVDTDLSHLINVLLYPGKGNIKLFFNKIFLIIILSSFICFLLILNTINIKNKNYIK